MFTPSEEMAPDCKLCCGPLQGKSSQVGPKHPGLNTSFCLTLLGATFGKDGYKGKSYCTAWGMLGWRMNVREK